MFLVRKKHIVLSILTGIILGLMTLSPVTATEANRKGGFEKIQQPLAVKLLVSAGGIGLIGLELWWFLVSDKTAKKAEEKVNIQEVTITVDGGYDPTEIFVHSGKPVRLNFLRRDPSSCLEQVLIPDFNRSVSLALNQITSVEFTPTTPGNYEFTCGMKMYRGKIIVD